MGVLNAMTVDVEDYFHVSAFEKEIPMESWDSIPMRVVENTERILDLFDEHSVKGTFFVLGWVAQRAPGLVRSISERGHEIACHGMGHQRIYKIGREAFEKDIDRSKKLLEDISGQSVMGYRAPSYSITSESIWALDVLIDAGFTYDSSIFPIHHDLYGMPDAKRHPHSIERDHGVIREFPPTTYQMNLLGRKVNIPVSGGGYLRLLPVKFISGALRRINEQGNEAVIYFHPWEIDPEQPRIKAGLKSRFRHYVNLGKTYSKLESLLDEFSFAPMAQVLGVERGL